MMIAKNDEEKRSKVWRIVTAATTIIIILIVGFFITKLFMGNPLEGIWQSENNNMTFIIGNGGRLTVEWDELFDETNVEVKMNYTLDKDAKTIQIKADEASLKKAAEKSGGKVSKEKLETALSVITTTFDYSVEQNELILTEREYGEQMVFTKN